MVFDIIDNVIECCFYNWVFCFVCEEEVSVFVVMFD